MEKKVKPVKEMRQRKFLLIVPLLVLPFLTMIFWALGGGKAEKAEAQAEVKKGFNINLPDANMKDKPMDKMSYYNQARQDSLKQYALEKNDPDYKNNILTDVDESISANDSFLFSGNKRGLNTSLYGIQQQSDSKTEKIYQKLAELNKEMNKPVTDEATNGAPQVYRQEQRKNNNAAVNSSNVERLEQMMNTMNQPSGDDPEMNQLNGILDKILDAQHPERVQEKLKKTSESNRGKVYAVTSEPDNNYITRLDTSEFVTNMTNSFYSLNDAKEENARNVVSAVIHQSQTIVDGSTVELRLTNDVFINGVQIPKGNLIYGIAFLNGERLNIKINNIRYKNSLFPVELSVYDMDGINGIHIPGAITRDVAKQSANRSMQAIGLTSLDPTWQAQAAGAGIEAAKSLFSKKIKLIKLTLKAGYQVLLRNEKQMQNQFK